MSGWVPLTTLGAAVVAAGTSVANAVMTRRGAKETATTASLSAKNTADTASVSAVFGNCMTMLQSTDLTTRDAGRTGLAGLVDVGGLSLQQARVASAILDKRTPSAIHEALKRGAEIELVEEEQSQPGQALKEKGDTEGDDRPEGTG